MLIIKRHGKIETEKTFQKFLDKKLQYLSNKNGFLGIDNKFNFKEKVMLLELKDFENYLHKNNLKIISVYGNYKLSSFDINKSPRLILISKKNPA